MCSQDMESWICYCNRGMNIIFSSYFGCYYKTVVVEEFSAALLPRAMQDSGKMLRVDVVNVEPLQLVQYDSKKILAITQV